MWQNAFKRQEYRWDFFLSPITAFLRLFKEDRQALRMSAEGQSEGEVKTPYTWPWGSVLDSDPFLAILQASAPIELPPRLILKARVTPSAHLVLHFVLCLTFTGVLIYTHRVPGKTCTDELSVPLLRWQTCLYWWGAAANLRGTHHADYYQWQMALGLCCLAPSGDKGNYITGDKSDQMHVECLWVCVCVCFSCRTADLVAFWTPLTAVQGLTSNLENDSPDHPVPVRKALYLFNTLLLSGCFKWCVQLTYRRNKPPGKRIFHWRLPSNKTSPWGLFLSNLRLKWHLFLAKCLAVLCFSHITKIFSFQPFYLNCNICCLKLPEPFSYLPVQPLLTAENKYETPPVPKCVLFSHSWHVCLTSLSPETSCHRPAEKQWWDANWLKLFECKCQIDKKISF